MQEIINSRLKAGKTIKDMYRIGLKGTGIIIRESIARFKRNDPLRLASSAAFFTVFAMPPILIIVINILGIAFNEEIVSGVLFEDLSQIFGKDSARQVELVLNNVQQKDQNWFFTIVGVFFLILTSTTVFIVVQNSINELWNIKQKKTNKRKNLEIMLRHRITSLAIILFSGLLVLISLLSDFILVLLENYLDKIIPKLNGSLIHMASHATSIAVFTAWFAIIFKYLPDVRIHWKAVWMGAIVTGILFEIGKYILGRLLVHSGMASSIFGAAGSIILLLLFIFYSSMILFYGASFTKAYAVYTNLTFEPRAYAMEYEIKEIEKKKE